MPSGSRRLCRSWENRPYVDDVVSPRCRAVARFVIPGGPIVEVQCTRNGHHKDSQGGHWITLDLLHKNDKIIRKPDGVPLRIRLGWRGERDGKGDMPPTIYLEYDPEIHGNSEEGTFDFKAYLDGTMEP
jgi:hypothetical protein